MRVTWLFAVTLLLVGSSHVEAQQRPRSSLLTQMVTNFVDDVGNMASRIGTGLLRTLNTNSIVARERPAGPRQQHLQNNPPVARQPSENALAPNAPGGRPQPALRQNRPRLTFRQFVDGFMHGISNMLPRLRRRISNRNNRYSQVSKRSTTGVWSLHGKHQASKKPKGHLNLTTNSRPLSVHPAVQISVNIFDVPNRMTSNASEIHKDLPRSDTSGHPVRVPDRGVSVKYYPHNKLDVFQFSNNPESENPIDDQQIKTILAPVPGIFQFPNKPESENPVDDQLTKNILTPVPDDFQFPAKKPESENHVDDQLTKSILTLVPQASEMTVLTFGYNDTMTLPKSTRRFGKFDNSGQFQHSRLESLNNRTSYPYRTTTNHNNHNNNNNNNNGFDSGNMDILNSVYLSQMYANSNTAGNNNRNRNISSSSLGFKEGFLKGFSHGYDAGQVNAGYNGQSSYINNQESHGNQWGPSQPNNNNDFNLNSQPNYNPLFNSYSHPHVNINQPAVSSGRPAFNNNGQPNLKNGHPSFNSPSNHYVNPQSNSNQPVLTNTHSNSYYNPQSNSYQPNNVKGQPAHGNGQPNLNNQHPFHSKPQLNSLNSHQQSSSGSGKVTFYANEGQVLQAGNGGKCGGRCLWDFLMWHLDHYSASEGSGSMNQVKGALPTAARGGGGGGKGSGHAVTVVQKGSGNRGQSQPHHDYLLPLTTANVHKHNPSSSFSPSSTGRRRNSAHQLLRPGTESSRAKGNSRPFRLSWNSPGNRRYLLQVAQHP